MLLNHNECLFHSATDNPWIKLFVYTCWRRIDGIRIGIEHVENISLRVDLWGEGKVRDFYGPSRTAKDDYCYFQSFGHSSAKKGGADQVTEDKD